MSNNTEVNSREKTLAENVIIIALIAILMSSFLYYFFKQEKQLTQVGFDAVARSFSASIIGIRAQWFMDGQPKSFVLKENNRPSILIKVNKNGWLDYSDEKNNCQRVWQNAMSTGLNFMNQPIVVLEIKREGKKETNNEISDDNENSWVKSCRFSLLTGESFDYQMDTGKVTAVKVNVSNH